FRHRVRPPILRRQFKALELKSRRDCAADQRPCAEALRRLPRAGRHDRLWRLPGPEIDSEPECPLAALPRDPQPQRCAGMKMPDFGRVDVMPVRAFAGLQQKIDSSGAGASVRPGGIAECLAKMSALR